MMATSTYTLTAIHNWGFDRVLGGAVEAFDAQMLLDPLEEKFDLPATLVQRADRQRREFAVVGQEDDALVRDGVAIANTPHVFGVVAGGVEVVERDTLIANQTCAAIDRSGVDAPSRHVVFGARDKEASCLAERVQTSEVVVPTIHDVKSSRFGQQQIEYVDFVEFAVGDVK